jgi:hypothetical protein
MKYLSRVRKLNLEGTAMPYHYGKINLQDHVPHSERSEGRISWGISAALNKVGTCSFQGSDDVKLGTTVGRDDNYIKKVPTSNFV